MNITIVHEAKTLKGRVIYDFKKLKDVILVRFDHPYDGDQREVIFYFSHGEWNDVNNLRHQYPHLFARMKYKLLNVFNEAGRCR